MDLTKVNLFLKKYMKNLYDLDVYISKDPNDDFGLKYMINVVMPHNKLLKRGPEFSEKTYDFLSKSTDDIQDKIEDTLKYIGQKEEFNGKSDIEFLDQTDEPDYLSNYKNESLKVIQDYLRSKGYNPNIKFDGYRFFLPSQENDEIIGIDIKYKGESYFRHKLNEEILYEFSNFYDYLKQNMDYDPQIYFWFT